MAALPVPAVGVPAGVCPEVRGPAPSPAEAVRSARAQPGRHPCFYPLQWGSQST